MKLFIIRFVKIFLSSTRDVMPILLVVLFFQVTIFANPIADLSNLFVGLVFVVLGLALFIFGLELGLFPIGESTAVSLANKGSLFWLIIFAFFLGFGTTFAEPALITIATEAAEVAFSGGIIESHKKIAYATNLRLVVALAVGFAIVLGVLRILNGWSIRNLLISGYLIIIVIALFAPKNIIGIAYDVGGVTTSTITVPLVTALGIGLARSIRGSNPMLDGFGIIAFASLTPIIFVLIYGIIT